MRCSNIASTTGCESCTIPRVTAVLTLGSRVYGVRYRNKRGFERKEECERVILTTGGVSYPATGSTGDGYAFAADLGHTIESLRPSLTPLVTSHPQMKFLHGLLLRNVRAVLYVDNEAVREEFGELGFRSAESKEPSRCA